jgi:outer membrane protein assembly factor BamB
VKLANNKTKTITIALFLMFAMAFSLVALPAANAQVPEYIKATTAFIGATPNPVGVNQETLLHIGITDGMCRTIDGWEGLTVTVEKPDGTTDTLGPYRTDSTGGIGDIYVPTIEGTYYLQTHFPAQWYNFTETAPHVVEVIPKFYKASTSEKLALNVTQEPITYYPSVPLPTEYWVRPIDSQLREWSTIAGNWLAAPPNRFAPYNDAPESAHILWAKQLDIGGLAGGATGDKGFGIGDAYEGRFSSSVIISGVLYYNRYTDESRGGFSGQGIVAVDLHTGEELWFKNNTRLAFGQVYYFGAWNYMGAFEYLWETVGGRGQPENWNAYDPVTGEWVYTVTDVPSGTNLYGPNGEICRYTVDLAHGWMTLWNSSRTVQPQNSSDPYYDGSWAQSFSYSGYNRVYPASRGIEWNKTIPTGLPGSVVAQFLEDRIIGARISYSGRGNVWGMGTWLPTAEDTVWAINVKPGHEGELLYNKTWSAPSEWITGDLTLSWVASSQEDMVGVIWAKDTRAHYGVNLETGELLWGPTESQYYLDAWEGTQLTTHLIAYGRLYASGVGGTLYCYDVTTGDLLWTYEAEDPYTEILFSNNWWVGAPFISDGKIYLGHGEHSSNQPLPRGAPFICVNATSGDEIWRIDGAFRQTGWGGLAVIGDSIIATMDTYDLRVYAIGKGPSATTVAASPKVSVHGSSVLVEGTVTDISPGTEDYALRARFPNGVPAVSDESMSDWMLYVYKQFPRPANATGVEVTLDVLDSNGNYRNIGTATADANGAFSFMWKPDIPGKYTLYATFAGSKSYYSSCAETAFGVEEAPTATPEPTPQPASAADLYFVPATTGIIIAIVIVGAILILMLRKR